MSIHCKTCGDSITTLDEKRRHDRDKHPGPPVIEQVRKLHDDIELTTLDGTLTVGTPEWGMAQYSMATLRELQESLSTWRTR